MFFKAFSWPSTKRFMNLHFISLGSLSLNDGTEKSLLVREKDMAISENSVGTTNF